MTLIVTGAAGFIGANIVKALNERGETRIIAVDNLTRADKFRNLVDCEIDDYLTRRNSSNVSHAVISARYARFSMKAPVRTRWKPTVAT